MMLILPVADAPNREVIIRGANPLYEVGEFTLDVPFTGTPTTGDCVVVGSSTYHLPLPAVQIFTHNY